MRIIGIDPGLERTGVAVLEKKNGAIALLDACRIRTPSGMKLANRLQLLKEDLTLLLKEWRPQRAHVEELFFSTNVKTAMAVAHARGVILETLAAHGAEIIELNPGRIKQALTGDARADKKQIKKMLHALLRINLGRDDTLDAIACGLCGVL